MTIHLAYQQLLAQLYELYEDREAANIADMVIENVTGQRKIDRILYKELPLSQPQQERLALLTKALLQHRPVQYVLNEAWFINLKLYVDDNVLIPRPETAELVDWVVRDLKTGPRSADKLCLLDIGTGSGCIPIALKKQLPAYAVSAVDVSENALEIARKNAHAHQAQIDFKQLDFLNTKHWKQLTRFDVIISNPPYIKNSEQENMSANVLQHEPHLALFVPDENALVFYVAIAEFAQEHLAKTGSIYVEINEALGQQVVEMFNANGFKKVEIQKDLQGKDRMVKAGF